MHGGVLPVSGTFFVFLDYMRPPVRLASLSRAKVVFVFSHDSVGVGEDGPTHQPVEQLATLRAIPGLQVIRPADANETAAAWRAAVDHDGPTALVLTRQGVPVCTDGSAVERGAGIVRDADGDPAVVHRRHRQRGRRSPSTPPSGWPTDGIAARVVSLPSWDRFAAQDADVPRRRCCRPACPCCRSRPATTFGWERYADDSHRHRPLRRQRTRRRGAATARHQRRARGASAPARSFDSAAPSRRSPMERLIRLYEEFGQSPWLDNLKRGYLTSGQLAELRDGGIRGLTSNPTIFQKAIADSADYDEQFRQLPATTARSSTTTGRSCSPTSTRRCDVLDPVYESSDGGDGFVSVEVAPDLADDTAGTETAARDLHERIARRNLMVKIPATAAGVAPIRQMISEGRNINITLIFSLERYQEVMDAYLDGLEAYAATDRTPTCSSVASVASFFVSRVDTEVDRRLEAIGTPEALDLRGKAAVAQAKLAYRAVPPDVLRSAVGGAGGARRRASQRPLWASTSTKNPAYPDTLYVDELIGPDTVNTLPDATIEAFADHGTLERRVDADVDVGRGDWQRWPRSASTWPTSPSSSSARECPASRRASTSCCRRCRRSRPSWPTARLPRAWPATIVAAGRAASSRSSTHRAIRGIAVELLGAALRAADDQPDPLDLKIAAAAMTEIREAFAGFAPYRDVQKVTVFGSARTAQHDPVYEQARRIAATLAGRGWMVVTGAGPGIMQAAMEGAGASRASAWPSACPSSRAPTR